MKNTFNRPASAFAAFGTAAVLATLLSACGGGHTSTPGPEADKPLSVAGVAATSLPGSAGNALANAAVAVYCRQGYGIGMTDAAGAYSVTVTPPAQGPCVVTLTTYNNVLSLRSLAYGDGARANITPVTEMLVQYVSTQAGLAPAHTSTAATVLATDARFLKLMGNQASLGESSAAMAKVLQTLGGSATPLLTVPADFLGGALVPKSAAATGNANDQFLDLLRTRNLLTATGFPATAALTAVNNEAKLHLVPAN